jgi:hypothetical protein
LSAKVSESVKSRIDASSGLSLGALRYLPLSSSAAVVLPVCCFQKSASPLR